MTVVLVLKSTPSSWSNKEKEDLQGESKNEKILWGTREAKQEEIEETEILPAVRIRSNLCQQNQCRSIKNYIILLFWLHPIDYLKKQISIFSSNRLLAVPVKKWNLNARNSSKCPLRPLRLHIKWTTKSKHRNETSEIWIIRSNWLFLIFLVCEIYIYPSVKYHLVSTGMEEGLQSQLSYITWAI